MIVVEFCFEFMCVIYTDLRCNMEFVNDIILRSTDNDLSVLVDLVSHGHKLLCPICQAEVWVIDTNEKMYKYQSARGARCSHDAMHYSFYLIEKRTNDFLKEITKE
jgi:hypothetical protein